MLVSGIVILAAALWCNAVVQANPALVINIHEVKIENTDNAIFGKSSVTVTQASPLNKASFAFSVLQDITETTKLKLSVKVDGKSLPVVDTTVCAALKDPVIGEPFIGFSDLNPAICPIKKGEYKVMDYTVSTKNLPPLQPGKFEIKVDFIDKSGKVLMTISGNGEISTKVPGLG